MSAAIEIRTDGQQEIERRLVSIAAATGDLSPLLADFGMYLESSTIERFDTETAPDGSKWKASIRAKEEGGKTLTDSATLRRSIRHISNGDSVEIGSNLEYAGVHNFGFSGTVQVPGHVRETSTVFGRRLGGPIAFKVGPFARTMNIPQREFLGLSAEDETELGALTDDYILAAGGTA